MTQTVQRFLVACRLLEDNGYRNAFSLREVDIFARVETVLGEMSASALIGGRVAWTRTHYDIDDTPTFKPWRLSPFLGFELDY